MLSSSLLENSLYFGGNETINFQELLGSLDKTIVTNLGRQKERSLERHMFSYSINKTTTLCHLSY